MQGLRDIFAQHSKGFDTTLLWPHMNIIGLAAVLTASNMVMYDLVGFSLLPSLAIMVAAGSTIRQSGKLPNGYRSAQI